MGMSWAEHSVEIEAPIETSFDAIVDYETFPRWQDAVDSVEVRSRTPDGLGEDVHLFVDAKVRKIDYVLRYRYKRPTRIAWDFVEGNGMRDVDGLYTLEEIGPDRTRATYKLGADPEIPVPGMILRRTHKQLVKRSVEDLKREAERRHAAGESQLASPAADEPAPGASAAKPIYPVTETQHPYADPEASGDFVAESPYDALAEAEPATRPGRAEGRAAGGDDWVPMAVRRAGSRGQPGPGPGTSSGAPRPSGARSAGSPADLAGELLDHAVGSGRDVAHGAMRAGRGAAEQAAHVAADILRRVNRRLGDRD